MKCLGNGFSSFKQGAAVAILILMISRGVLMAAQPDYVADESPAPGSAEEIEEPISRGFIEKIIEPPFVPELKKKAGAFAAILEGHPTQTEHPLLLFLPGSWGHN